MSLIFSAVMVFITIWVFISKRRSDKLHLVPLCALKPEASIEPWRESDKRGPTEEYMLDTSVKIFPHGGKILYPMLTYYVTFDNSDEVKGKSLKYYEATPVITDSKRGYGGPWDHSVFITEDEKQRIKYLFLLLECRDQLLNEYFTIARFKYRHGWAWNRVIHQIKRKRWYHEAQIKQFKEAPKEWIKEHGEEGTSLQEWSDTIKTDESI